MQEAALVAAVLEASGFDSSHPDFTSARIRVRLNDVQMQVFGHRIIQAKAGAWVKHADTTTTAGRSRYRMPVRAAAGVSESVLWNGGTPLPPYNIEGDVIAFGSVPSVGSTLRFLYYLRPSAIVAEQTAGAVTAVDTTALTVTVNSVPTDRGAATAVVTGDVVDIVHSTGWHELSVVGVAATLSGSVFTFPAGTDLSDVVVGDYVRADGETDWPCLPDDYHDALVSLTAARMLRAKSLFQKADALEAQADADLQRFADALQPRIKQEREVVVPMYGILRGRSRSGFSGNDTFGGWG